MGPEGDRQSEPVMQSGSELASRMHPGLFYCNVKHSLYTATCESQRNPGDRMC